MNIRSIRNESQNDRVVEFRAHTALSVTAGTNYTTSICDYLHRRQENG